MSVEQYWTAVSNLGPGAREPYPRRLQEVTDIRPAVKFDGYIDPENALGLVTAVLQENRPTNPGIKAGLGVTKAHVLAYIASFCDAKGVRLIPQIVNNSRIAGETVELIEEHSKLSKTPLRIDAQLELALQASDNNLATAVLGLAVGTRHMARAMDGRVMPRDFSLDESRMIEWKVMLAPISGEPNEDTAGNNYHFWERVLAGMSSEEGCDPRSVVRLKSSICRTIHTNTAPITEFLRYRLSGNTGETHNYADTLGLHIGIAMANKENYEQLLHV